MKAVWFVRSRQFSSEFKFVLTIIGYNPKNNGLGELIYLVYALLFFAVWGLAVLAWCASGAAAFLQIPGFGDPAVVAEYIVMILIAIWWVVSLYNATRQSPDRFSTQDAVLICMTSISRRAVIFTDYAKSALLHGIPFWIITAVLAFGMVDIRLGGQKVWENFSVYFGSALRFLLPITLLVFALLALSWSLGCYRLQGSHRRRSLIWVPIAAGLVLGLGIAAVLADLSPWQVLALPIARPVMAGSGAASFLSGLWIAAACFVIGIGMLYWTSRRVSLARMAQQQETSVSLGESMLNSRAVQERKLRKRLSSGRQPSRLLPFPREGAIIWKKIVKTTRRGLLRELGNWLYIFAIGLAIMLDPDLISRWLLVVLWVLQVHALTARDICEDLEMWQLTLGLPFRPAWMLIYEVVPNALLATLFSWAGLVIYQVSGLGAAGVEVFLFLPFVLLAVTGVAAYDINSHTEAKHLMAGNIPRPGMLALVLALIVMVLNTLLLTVSTPILRLLGLALLNSGICLFLPKLLISGFRKIGK